ncbi:hypothetical protein [Paenibacillus mendelii]|uniref:Uncharacterized protein n=1 Tax=Paenibacillus mendelii TaxID=206163 RepID=A0ABV6JGI6_9BACL|nr:hypothetical protein [Paenibacillus mendelii]MCQ6557434.1 hypothetical protein [Paenibacillus mendelii]
MNRVRSSAAEQERAGAFYNSLLSNASQFPISFVYDGKAHHGLNEQFSIEVERIGQAGDKETAVITAMHDSGLQVTIHTALYPEYIRK